jgi:hypothetical protein
MNVTRAVKIIEKSDMAILESRSGVGAWISEWHEEWNGMETGSHARYFRAIEDQGRKRTMVRQSERPLIVPSGDDLRYGGTENHPNFVATFVCLTVYERCGSERERTPKSDLAGSQGSFRRDCDSKLNSPKDLRSLAQGNAWDGMKIP